MTSFFFLSSTFRSDIAIHIHYLHMLGFFFLVSQFFLTAKACFTYDKFLKPGKLLTNKLHKLFFGSLLFILFSWLRQRVHGRGYWWCSLLHSKWSCLKHFRDPCLLCFCFCWLFLIYSTVFIALFHNTKEVMELMYIILFILAVIYLISKNLLRCFFFRILMN